LNFIRRGGKDNTKIFFSLLIAFLLIFLGVNNILGNGYDNNGANFIDNYRDYTARDIARFFLNKLFSTKKMYSLRECFQDIIFLKIIWISK